MVLYQTHGVDYIRIMNNSLGNRKILKYISKMATFIYLSEKKSGTMLVWSLPEFIFTIC